MVKDYLLYAIIAFASATMVSCSGNKSTSADDSDSVANDSIAREKVERLPDTTYVSADVIKFEVTVVDTATTGRLETIENLYSESPASVMLFRKGPKRDADFNGSLDTIPHNITVDWRYATEEHPGEKTFDRWGGGTGWSGQPLYIEWPDSLADRLKKSGLVNSDFHGKEVLFGSLVGKIYCLDPTSGKPTREPINVNNPIKGTMSFDPTFNGNLYVGQGIPATRPFGALVVDLFSNSITDTFGEDSKAWRQWGAYDSSAIRVGQFLFRPSENGSLYKFTIEPGKQNLHTVLRYRAKGSALGIEASMAVYANYGFIADNHGNVIAVNLDTMKPVWHYWLGDDTDATPLVAVEDGTPYLYVGSEEDLSNREYAQFAKLNAVTGEEIWSKQIPAKRKPVGDKHFDGGFYASPLLGKGNCEGLIFTNLVKNTSGSNGCFIAFDRKTGDTVYELPLKMYSWSSPVGTVTKDGQMVIILGDGAGNIYVIDAKKGEIVTSKNVGHNFESSPILIGNCIFVGSRTNGLFRISFN